MKTECTAGQLEFHRPERRVVDQLDGGKISSDSGGLLLREVEQRTQILKRLAKCFVDTGKSQRGCKTTERTTRINARL